MMTPTEIAELRATYAAEASPIETEITQLQIKLAALWQRFHAETFGNRPTGAIYRKRVHIGRGIHAQVREQRWRILGYSANGARVLQIKQDGSDGVRHDIVQARYLSNVTWEPEPQPEA